MTGHYTEQHKCNTSSEILFTYVSVNITLSLPPSLHVFCLEFYIQFSFSYTCYMSDFIYPPCLDQITDTWGTEERVSVKFSECSPGR